MSSANLSSLGEQLNNATKSIKADYNTNPTIYNDISTLSTSLNNKINAHTVEGNQANYNANINQEILLKQEQLLKMQNDDLDSQLSSLDLSQNYINNKSRMIDQTNDALLKKNKYITFLIVTSVFAILSVIVILLYGMKKIDDKKLKILLIILFIIYVCVYLYVYNIFYLNDAFKYMFFSKEVEMGQKLGNWVKKVDDNIATSLYGTEQEWIDENCATPCDLDDLPGTEEEDDVYATYTENTISPTPGYFYNDSSAPPQLIYPSPTKSNAANTDYAKIVRPDYSTNSKKYEYNIKPQKQINNVLNSRILDTGMVLAEDGSILDNNMIGTLTYTSNL
jgi:hypothetical protein